jgi:outer membrane receptor protein involved in Fe transport
VKTINKMTALKAGVAPFALGLAIISAPALAQEAPEGDAQAPEGTIVVTGSRIARPDLESTSPVSFVGAEEFELQQTVNVEEVLNDMPQVIPATTGTSNNPGGGVATVDLRGLGTQRTLVLVDGRRYVSFDDTQVVDLNTIPASLIERVDVVTGGASAVYGSDAISGVVNFITKTDFSGIEMNTGYEISQEGDGGRWNVDGTIGANFDDDRGNVVVHAGYFQRDPIFAGDRKATTVSFSDPGGGGALFPGGSSGIPSFRINFGAGNRRFDQGGNLIPYSATTDLYNFGPVNYLQVPQERFLGYSKAQYEITENFRPYIEGVFISNRVTTQLAPTPITNTTPFRDGSLGGNLFVSVNSPFLGASTRATLAALDTDGDGLVAPASFGRRFLETGPRINADDRNAFRVLAGMEGEIGGNWNYDGYYSYSRTKNSQVQSGNIQLSALIAGLQTAFQNPTTGAISITPIAGLAGGGTLVCRDASARANGCVPVNAFGENNVSQAAVDYISIQAQNQEEAVTQVAQFAVTNSSLFDLGAGGVGIAIGAEHRREEAEFIPDTFLSSGDVGGFNAGDPTAGGYNVTEFFGEVNVPLLADTFIRRLEVNGAARYSNYSNAVGNVFTWAVGGLLEPVEGLTFRGNYQRAIRGPSVNELFGGQTVSFDGAVDPCGTPEALSGALRTACIANGVPAAVVGTMFGSGGTSFPAQQGGNPNLREEKAKTYTFGVAFVPSFFEQLSITVDYYNIRIDNAIGTVGAQNIVDACLRFNQQSYCDLISRDPTGEFESFVDLNFNAASLKTDGIDVGARLNVPLGFGMSEDQDMRVSFDFKGSYLMSLDYIPVVGLPIENECAGRFGRTCSDTVAFGPTPKWRHAFRTTLREGPGFFSFLWRYIGKTRDDDDTFTYAVERLKAKSYFDATLGYDVNDNLSIAAGVDNIFNTGFQPLASTQQGGNGQQSNTYPATYDTLGRYYSISAKVRF